MADEFIGNAKRADRAGIFIFRGKLSNSAAESAFDHAIFNSDYRFECLEDVSQRFFIQRLHKSEMIVCKLIDIGQIFQCFNNIIAYCAC